jgi:hypothetical protein
MNLSVVSPSVVQRAWCRYRECAMPRPLSIQYVDMRRAFFAGAQALLDLMSSELDHDGDITNEDLAFLLGVRRELADFAQRVTEGSA